VAGLGCENCTFNPVETELAAFSPELDRATLEERYVGGRWVCGCCRHGCHTSRTESSTFPLCPRISNGVPLLLTIDDAVRVRSS
jgi:hypothetical protein